MSAPIDQPDYTMPTLLASSIRDSGVVVIPNLAQVVVITVNGTGELFWLLTEFAHDLMLLRIFCDGNLAWDDSPNHLNILGYRTDTPCVSLTTYLAAGLCAIQINLNFKFRTQLRIEIANFSGAPQIVRSYASLSLIR